MIYICVQECGISLRNTDVYHRAIVFFMKWIVAGLGNPDESYKGTRHNVGRDFLQALADTLPKNAKVVTPDVYMNNSGGPLRKLIPSKKAAETLVVLHDELDLPLGKVKISYGSSAGGHNGVKSVQAALKTMDFTRIRIGISPSTVSGKLKRPDGEKIVDFVLGKFKPAEQEKLKKVKKIVREALEIILEEGKDAAMGVINSK
jgi:PTH1 family peptidyl-tRNA hydrolase